MQKLKLKNTMSGFLGGSVVNKPPDTWEDPTCLGVTQHVQHDY